MAEQTVQTYDAHGRLVHEETMQVPDPPVDPIQAQIDALTDIVLGGGAA